MIWKSGGSIVVKGFKRGYYIGWNRWKGGSLEGRKIKISLVVFWGWENKLRYSNAQIKIFLHPNKIFFFDVSTLIHMPATWLPLGSIKPICLFCSRLLQHALGIFSKVNYLTESAGYHCVNSSNGLTNGRNYLVTGNNAPSFRSTMICCRETFISFICC